MAAPAGSFDDVPTQAILPERVVVQDRRPMREALQRNKFAHPLPTAMRVLASDPVCDHTETAPTPLLNSTSARESRAPGTRVKYAHTPRLSRVSSPASTSTFK